MEESGATAALPRSGRLEQPWFHLGLWKKKKRSHGGVWAPEVLAIFCRRELRKEGKLHHPENRDRGAAGIKGGHKKLSPVFFFQEGSEN